MDMKYIILIGKDWYGVFNTREEAIKFKNNINDVADWHIQEIKSVNDWKWD